MLPTKVTSLIVLVATLMFTMLAGCDGGRQARKYPASDGSPVGTIDYIVYSRAHPTLKLENDAPTFSDQDSAVFRFPPGATSISGENLDKRREPNHGTVSVRDDKLQVEITLGNGKPHPLNGSYTIIDGLSNQAVAK